MLTTYCDDCKQTIKVKWAEGATLENLVAGCCDECRLVLKGEVDAARREMHRQEGLRTVALTTEGTRVIQKVAAVASLALLLVAGAPDAQAFLDARGSTAAPGQAIDATDLDAVARPLHDVSKPPEAMTIDRGTARSGGTMDPDRGTARPGKAVSPSRGTAGASGTASPNRRVASPRKPYRAQRGVR